MTGTSWHVTAKSSIRNWVMLYKSGVYASRVTVLTPGGLPYALTSRLRLTVGLRGEQSPLTVWQKSAEGIVGALSPEVWMLLNDLTGKPAVRVATT